MMVTIISQCEKKALARTRRVLDAFANRIGDNTWQTVITEEGLVTLKKLLRQTASKNTAISCHWIRSRSRSQLLWVVGNRNKFNTITGFVPVNYTSKELFMDIKPIKLDKTIMYANTHGQPLTEHLFAVGYVASKIYKLLFKDTKLCDAIFIAGILHDIGKLDNYFQTWLHRKKGLFIDIEDGQHIDDNKKDNKINTSDPEMHPRHHEISLLLYFLLDNKEFKGLNKVHREGIKHAIFWHHAKPLRKLEFKNYHHIYQLFVDTLKNSSFELFYQSSYELLVQVSKLGVHYSGANYNFMDGFCENLDQDSIDDLKKAILPQYKDYDDRNNSIDVFRAETETNSRHNIIRACIVTADRLISALSQQELENHIHNKTLEELLQDSLKNESNLSSEIELYLQSFGRSSRSEKQHEIALKLAEDNIDNNNGMRILAGAAGCGKTKIALEWAKLNCAQKIIWVCPRVQICQGIFEELTDFNNRHSLSHTNIEILTGEFKYQKQNGIKKITPNGQEFSGDIVITTIDQILNSIITHTRIDSFIDFLNTHVVFDEYHEYVNMTAFNLLFAELVHAKHAQQRNNILLVSATPHYFYLEKMLGIDDPNLIVEMPSFNQSLYSIKLVEYDEKAQDASNPLYAKQTQKTFIISNTVKTAQLSFMHNKDENNILFHSKFKRSDKQQIFDNIFNCFKQDGDNKYLVLRSGPIIQASLNVSCHAMISEITTAENTLQRLGRLNRFGENPEQIYPLTLLITDGIQRGKKIGRAATFLKNCYELQATTAWTNWLMTQLSDKTYKLSELYQLYKAFYKNKDNQIHIEDDFLISLKESAKKINDKILEPIVIKPKGKDKSIAKVSKNSLRGNTVFVQMAVCDVSAYPDIKMLNEYAYTPVLDEHSTPDFMTEELKTLESYGIIDYAAQKHGRIDKTHPIVGIPDKNMTSRKSVLKGAARSSEYPIYTSYIQDHLDSINEKLNENGLVYAISHKQAIGSIAYDVLTNQSNDLEE